MMATAYSLDRWLRRIEQAQRHACVQRDQLAEAERLLREGDPISRRWAWMDPDDGSRLEMAWNPSMGPWEPLMLLIDAAEDVAHGIPRRGRNGEMLTLEMLNRAIVERVNRAGTVVALRDEKTGAAARRSTSDGGHATRERAKRGLDTQHGREQQKGRKK